MPHRQAPPALALALLTGLLVGCQGPTEGLAYGEELYETCAQCHMADGHGNDTITTPAIAGLPQWYVEAQLHNFRDGVRGTHPEDLAGMRMRPMAMSLQNDTQLQAVAEYVSSLPAAPAGVATLGGDPTKGQTYYAVCLACHGADGSGNEALKAPAIAGSEDWYVVEQLEKFRSGARGADPRDAQGAQMRPMAMTLPDEQAMKDVAAYIQSL